MFRREIASGPEPKWPSAGRGAGRGRGEGSVGGDEGEGEGEGQGGKREGEGEEEGERCPDRGPAARGTGMGRWRSSPRATPLHSCGAGPLGDRGRLGPPVAECRGGNGGVEDGRIGFLCRALNPTQLSAVALRTARESLVAPPLPWVNETLPEHTPTPTGPGSAGTICNLMSQNEVQFRLGSGAAEGVVPCPSTWTLIEGRSSDQTFSTYPAYPPPGGCQTTWGSNDSAGAQRGCDPNNDLSA